MVILVTSDSKRLSHNESSYSRSTGCLMREVLPSVECQNLACPIKFDSQMFTWKVISEGLIFLGNKAPHSLYNLHTKQTTGRSPIYPCSQTPYSSIKRQSANKERVSLGNETSDAHLDSPSIHTTWHVLLGLPCFYNWLLFASMYYIDCKPKNKEKNDGSLRMRINEGTNCLQYKLSNMQFHDILANTFYFC